MAALRALAANAAGCGPDAVGCGYVDGWYVALYLPHDVSDAALARAKAAIDSTGTRARVYRRRPTVPMMDKPIRRSLEQGLTQPRAREARPTPRPVTRPLRARLASLGRVLHVLWWLVVLTVLGLMLLGHR